MWRNRCKNIVVMIVVHSVLHSRNTLPIVTSHAFNSAPPAAMLGGCVTFSYCVLTPRREQWSMHRYSTSPVSRSSNDVWDLCSPHNPHNTLLAWCSHAYPWEKIGLIWGWWQWKWRYHQSRVLPETRGNSVTSYQAISHHLHLPFCSGSTIN